MGHPVAAVVLAGGVVAAMGVVAALAVAAVAVMVAEAAAMEARLPVGMAGEVVATAEAAVLPLQSLCTLQAWARLLPSTVLTGAPLLLLPRSSGAEYIFAVSCRPRSILNLELMPAAPSLS